MHEHILHLVLGDGTTSKRVIPFYKRGVLMLCYRILKTKVVFTKGHAGSQDRQTILAQNVTISINVTHWVFSN